MLPSPPHCATSRPPGRSAARSRGTAARGRRSSGTSRSRGSRRRGSSSSSSSRSSDAHDRPPAPRRSRAASTIDGDSSTRDHAAPRQPLDQRLGDPPGAAAGVEHDLVTAQLQPRRAPRSPSASIVAGDAVIAAFRPTRVLAYVRTLSRIAARAASSASTCESCPPCHAIGERAGGPGVLDDEPRAGNRLRVALADGQRMARVGLVAAGDHDRRRPRCRRARQLPRTGASAARLRARRRPRSGCSCAARRWRSTVSIVARHALGHGVEVICAHEPLHATLAQPARERVPARELRRARAAAMGRRRA